MFAWIVENAVTLTACAIVLATIAVAIISLIRDKKNKKGGCTGNCATCGMACSYHNKKR